MIKVEMHLLDAQEMQWFGVFSTSIAQRREQKFAEANAAFITADALTADDDETTPEEGKVVGTITPAGAAVITNTVPTVAELEATVQAYIKGDAMAEQVRKVKDLLGEYGAKTLAEVPEEKRAELVGRLK